MFEYYVHSIDYTPQFHHRDLIDADKAKQTCAILGVRYLIYGNVTDVSEENYGFQESSVKVYKVKARIISIIIDAKTGKILAAAKGEGKSEISSVKLDDKFAITLGTKRVSQVSVHNALKKLLIIRRKF